MYKPCRRGARFIDASAVSICTNTNEVLRFQIVRTILIVDEEASYASGVIWYRMADLDPKCMLAIVGQYPHMNSIPT